MIAGAFPGLFSFSDFLSLDVRDLEFWLKEAQRKVLIEKINALSMSQMQGAMPDFVRGEFSKYENALAELEGTRSLKIKSVWDELKRKGKG